MSHLRMLYTHIWLYYTKSICDSICLSPAEKVSRWDESANSLTVKACLCIKTELFDQVVFCKAVVTVYLLTEQFSSVSCY